MRACGILLAGVLLFMLPGLFRVESLFFDDAAHVSFPRLMGAARAVQAGEIPLWGPLTFCGARPFYAMSEGPTYNPLLYPFMWVANLEDLTHTFYWLYLLPFTLFLMLAAAGTFLFCRMALRVDRSAAVVAGWLYAFAPHMGVSFVSLLDTCTFAWLPWILLAVARWLDAGRLGWWAAGAVFMALMACASDANYAVRVYFVVGSMAGLRWLLRVRRVPRPFPRLVGLLGMLALGVGLAGVMWAGALEGVGWVTANERAFSYAEITKKIHDNMAPGHLATLFVPDFNGMLLGRYGWGTAELQGHAYILSGGLCTGLCMLAALCFCVGRGAVRAGKHSQAVWGRIAGIILLGTLLTMMGRYTPVYRVLCAVLPWFFRVPYPYYYRFAQCWCAAVLVALALSSYARLRVFRAGYGRWSVVSLYLGLVVLVCLLALRERAFLARGVCRGYECITFLRQWTWFLTGPVLYLAAGGVLLALAPFVLSRRGFGRFVLAGVVLETCVLGYLMLYRNAVDARETGGGRIRGLHQRYKEPGAHPFYAVVDELRRRSGPDAPRFVGSMSNADNMGWVAGAHAALGYDAKPVMPRFQSVVKYFTAGWPYELWTTWFPEFFLRNMNVGFLLAREGMVDERGVIEETIGGIRVRSFSRPTQPGRMAHYSLLIDGPGLELHELPEPIPYVYTQNCVVMRPKKWQRNALLTRDLRRAVCVSRAPAGCVPATEAPAAIWEGPPALASFDRLQAVNEILRVDRTRANRLVVDIDVTVPAMLVVAQMWHEGWRARVDGEPHAVLQVNYCQQGVWLENGRHRVVLRFFPRCLLIGGLVSAGSLLTIAAVCGVVLVRRRGERMNRE